MADNGNRGFASQDRARADGNSGWHSAGGTYSERDSSGRLTGKHVDYDTMKSNTSSKSSTNTYTKDASTGPSVTSTDTKNLRESKGVTDTDVEKQKDIMVSQAKRDANGEISITTTANPGSDEDERQRREAAQYDEENGGNNEYNYKAAKQFDKLNHVNEGANNKARGFDKPVQGTSNIGESEDYGKLGFRKRTNDQEQKETKEDRVFGKNAFDVNDFADTLVQSNKIDANGLPQSSKEELDKQFRDFYHFSPTSTNSSAPSEPTHEVPISSEEVNEANDYLKSLGLDTIAEGIPAQSPDPDYANFEQWQKSHPPVGGVPQEVPSRFMKFMTMSPQELERAKNGQEAVSFSNQDKVNIALALKQSGITKSELSDINDPDKISSLSNLGKAYRSLQNEDNVPPDLVSRMNEYTKALATTAKTTSQIWKDELANFIPLHSTIQNMKYARTTFLAAGYDLETATNLAKDYYSSSSFVKTALIESAAFMLEASSAIKTVKTINDLRKIKELTNAITEMSKSMDWSGTTDATAKSRYIREIQSLVNSSNVPGDVKRAYLGSLRYANIVSGTNPKAAEEVLNAALRKAQETVTFQIARQEGKAVVNAVESTAVSVGTAAAAGAVTGAVTNSSVPTPETTTNRYNPTNITTPELETKEENTEQIRGNGTTNANVSSNISVSNVAEDIVNKASDLGFDFASFATALSQVSSLEPTSLEYSESLANLNNDLEEALSTLFTRRYSTKEDKAKADELAYEMASKTVGALQNAQRRIGQYESEQLTNGSGQTPREVAQFIHDNPTMFSTSEVMAAQRVLDGTTDVSTTDTVMKTNRSGALEAQLKTATRNKFLAAAHSGDPEKLQDSIDTYKANFGVDQQTATDSMLTMNRALPKPADTLVSNVKALVNKISATLGLDKIKDKYNEFSEWVSEKTQPITSKVKEWLSTLDEKTGNIVGSAFRGAYDVISNLFSPVKSISSGLKTTQDVILGLVDLVTKPFNKANDTVQDWKANLDRWYSMGTAAVTGQVDANNLDAVMTAANTLRPRTLAYAIIEIATGIIEAPYNFQIGIGTTANGFMKLLSGFSNYDDQVIAGIKDTIDAMYGFEYATSTEKQEHSSERNRKQSSSSLIGSSSSTSANEDNEGDLTSQLLERDTSGWNQGIIDDLYSNNEAARNFASSLGK